MAASMRPSARDTATLAALPSFNLFTTCSRASRLGSRYLQHGMGRRQRAARAPAAPPAPPADGQELDIDAFSRSLHPAALAIRDVSNDGNCFFRAVSDQLFGTEDYHIKLRERTCDYLLANKDHYQFFVDDEQSFDDYVADMRTDGVWADNLELQAVSMAYDVNIRVHQSGKPSYDIRNHHAKNAKVIHLSYHFGEHYASVRPLATATLSIPAQHDPLPLPPPSSSLSSSSTSLSSSQDGPASPRRPRHGNTLDTDNVAAMWRRADRRHCELCSLVDKTRRAARTTRLAESTNHSMSTKKEVARIVERDMKEALAGLEEIGQLIMDGKVEHRMRMQRLSREHRNRAAQSENPAETDDHPTRNHTDPAKEQYIHHVRTKAEPIFLKLAQTEQVTRVALQKFKSVTAEHQAPRSSTVHAAPKHHRGGKKKEQDAKRRERKDRRRKEQEQIARALDIAI
ncbi:unnamed protein product [Chondrus crispus]|uniref:OTU domain-containing protein n=1 Tax=Chondrus crispus TaxID=2769 RepID=R7QGJ1_CHOCR|nr:unnamed protein product [Chondrus crispus]CDF36515.1 unnamed protein product [Chondrus crispus]|eukprot:XP_005716334.1 unnamed protein product [Chondrus crispus]